MKYIKNLLAFHSVFRYFIYFFFQFFFISYCSAVISDIKYISQILPAVTAGSLVVFDLDNTVMTTQFDGTFHTEPTEPDVPSIIRSFQNTGINVMAMTARDSILNDFTKTQLASIGISFELKQPYPFSFFIPGAEVLSYYTQGIAYVGPTANKGEEMIAFLKYIQQTPQRIIFVDNTPANVVDMENALSNYPYEHFSFHYEHGGW